jgi:4-amino-4-deoxy-L-arabinose transferase-like glycosyltransferase
MELSGKRYSLLAALLLAAAAVVLLVGVSSTPPVEQKEIRVWKVTSEMYANGNYLVPQIEGEPHLTKPPLYYWAAVLCGKAASRMDFLVFRLPSVAAALGVIVLTLLWSRRLGGNSLSLLSAAMLLAMARFPVWGRLATFEMMLALFSLGALFLFYRAYEDGKSGGFAFACVLFALAFLTKGTAALLLVCVPAAVYVLLRRELRLFRKPSSWAWMALAVALSVSWFAVLVWRDPEAREIFRAQLLLPFAIETEKATASHYQPFYYYFTTIFETTFPVTLLLPVLVRRAWITRCWRALPGYRFLFVVFVSVIVGFSFIPGKQKHYILAVFIPLAILIAESVMSGLAEGNRFTRLWTRGVAGFWGGALFLSVIPVGFCGGILFGWNPAQLAAALLGLAVAGAGLIMAAHRELWRRAALFAVVGTVVLYVFVLGSFLVWSRQFQTGTVKLRGDYNAARWEANFTRYPWLSKVFFSKEAHDTSAAETVEPGGTPQDR